MGGWALLVPSELQGQDPTWAGPEGRAGPRAKALEGCQIFSFTLLKGTEFGGAVIGREGAHHGAVKSLQRGFFPAAVRTERATLLVRRDRLLVPRSSVRLKFTGAAEVETHLFS